MPAVSRKQQIAMAISPQYVAGFLDGEGNITILERNRYVGYSSFGLHVGFTNCDLRPLLAIQELYGGSIFSKKRHSAKHRQSFELRIGSRKQVEKILRDLLPFLICKRERAEHGLAFLALGKVKKRVVGHRRFHPTKGGTVPVVEVVKGEQEMRAEFKRRLMLMNTRGQEAAQCHLLARNNSVYLR